MWNFSLKFQKGICASQSVLSFTGSHPCHLHTKHWNTCIIKQVTKRIVTNMLHNLFIAISASLNDFTVECKQFGVCITGDDFFETSNLPKLLSMRKWKYTTVKPQLSRLVGTRQKSPDNREYEY